MCVQILLHELGSLKVEIMHRGAERRKFRVIGISRLPASQLTFPDTERGTQVTVADYFKEEYQELRYPHLPCLHVGSPKRHVYLPMEVCKVIAQKRARRLDERMASEMNSRTCTRPQDRARHIHERAAAAEYHNDPYLQEFQLACRANLVEVEGRVLAPPSVQYGDSGATTTVQPKLGAWNMRNTHLHTPVPLRSWAVVNLGKSQDHQVHRFVELLVRVMSEMGILIEPQAQRPPIFKGAAGDTAALMAQAARAASELIGGGRPQLLMVLKPDTDQQSYFHIKRVSDTELGIPSQCCIDKHVFKCNRQYVSNVVLKVNAKLGGINMTLVENLPKFEQPTMIFGADVTHPGAGDKTMPSIAAVVASMDRYAARFSGAIRMQGHRVEIIADLEDCALAMLKQFYRSTSGIKPARIVFYRDGVSDGQFAHVMAQEVTALRRAFKRLDASYAPRITFIIVQKRHHTRFFAKRKQDSDRSGNPLPGTVVDSGVCHPSEFDFYLLSHAGIQGTSRPTKYAVLLDENNFSADELQTFTYNTCYTYSRSTRSVSMAPAAYYAHLLAARARCFYDGAESPSISVPEEEGEEEEKARRQQAAVEKKIAEFKSAREELDAVMYFV